MNWLKRIKNKSKCIFTQFGIPESYPSVSKYLLRKAMNYPKEFVGINEEIVTTIMDSRKCLLFSNTDIWVKEKVSKILR